MQHYLTSEAINTYAENYTTPESEVLQDLNRETYLKVPLPIMLSGHLQGAVLSMISKMIAPQNILEIGTYTGYSAICLAQGLGNNGCLDTVDNNEELQDRCNYYWEKAGLLNTIKMHIGNAQEILPTLNKTYDLVFIDADKKNYGMYYDLVFEKVPVGGYFLADNVLYDGEVILPENEQSKNAKAIQLFNEKIKNDNRVEQVLLPIRDGMLLIRKLH